MALVYLAFPQPLGKRQSVHPQAEISCSGGPSLCNKFLEKKAEYGRWKVIAFEAMTASAMYLGKEISFRCWHHEGKGWNRRRQELSVWIVPRTPLEILPQQELGCIILALLEAVLALLFSRSFTLYHQGYEQFFFAQSPVQHLRQKWTVLS